MALKLFDCIIGDVDAWIVRKCLTSDRKHDSVSMFGAYRFSDDERRLEKQSHPVRT